MVLCLESSLTAFAECSWSAGLLCENCLLCLFLAAMLRQSSASDSLRAVHCGLDGATAAVPPHTLRVDQMKQLLEQIRALRECKAVTSTQPAEQPKAPAPAPLQCKELSATNQPVPTAPTRKAAVAPVQTLPAAVVAKASPQDALLQRKPGPGATAQAAATTVAGQTAPTAAGQPVAKAPQPMPAAALQPVAKAPPPVAAVQDTKPAVQEQAAYASHRAHYMSFRRLFEKDVAGVKVTQQMMQAYSEGGVNRQKLFAKFVNHDKDLESISMEMMKACLRDLIL